MREPFEIIMYHNSEIEIYQDDSAESPNDWDTDSFLVYDHRQFATAPHGMETTEAQDIFERFCQKKVTYEWNKKSYWIIPVFALIHSGVSLYLNRRAANQYEPTGFDTSFKGFCLIDKTNPNYWAIADAYILAEEIIKEWNQYLSGDVYGYNSPVGSCWGFYGKEGRDQMIEEAKEEIDYDCRQKLLKKIDKVKIFIRNKVPLDVRERRIPIVN